MCKYPNVKVKLLGRDGNAFAIMGSVRAAMQKAKIDKSEIDAYLTEATSGDYNKLLSVTMNWVEVC
jgi:hypothetical protein